MKKKIVFLLLLAFLGNFAFAQGKARILEEILLASKTSKVLKAAQKASIFFEAMKVFQIEARLESKALFICYEEDEIVSHVFSKKTQLFHEERNFEKVTELVNGDFKDYEIFIEPEVYISDEFKPLKERLDFLNIVRPNNEIIKVYIKEHILEWSPSLKGIFVTDENVLDFCNVSTWGADPRDINVASVLDIETDYHTANSLKNITKKNNKNFDILTRENIDQVFARCKDKFLILTGHFDEGKFFARDQFYNPIPNQTFTAEEIEALGKKHEVYVLKIGCQTHRIEGGAGLLNDIYEEEVLERLDKALQEVMFFDILSQLGSKTNPLYINPIVYNKNRMVLTIRTEHLNSGLKNTFMAISSSRTAIYNPKGVDYFILRMTDFLKVILVLLGIGFLFIRNPVFIVLAVATLVLYGVIYGICMLI
jgi:purine-nucleoside phosphorylase